LEEVEVVEMVVIVMEVVEVVVIVMEVGVDMVKIICEMVI
jgi:hypothetical protein